MTSTRARNAMILDFAAGLAPTSIPASASKPSSLDAACRHGLKDAHSLAGGEVCERLGVDPRQGLSLLDAAKRLDQYGQNVSAPILEKAVGNAAWTRTRQMKFVTVLRGGEIVSVGCSHVVVGDIVFLEAGDDAPADIRILRSNVARQRKPMFTPEKGFVDTETEVSTSIDCTFISGLLPVIVSSAATSKAPSKANNMVLHGSTVLSGHLLGVVFATGSSCFIAKQSALIHNNPPGPPVPRMPRNADKKKVAKIATQLTSLGMMTRVPDALAPVCGTRRINLILRVLPSNFTACNALLKQLVAQGFRIVLVLDPAIKPEHFSPLPSRSVGPALPADAINVASQQDAERAVSDAKTQSAVFAYGPEELAENLTAAFSSQAEGPIILVSDEPDDRVAATRATFSVCTFAGPPCCLQAAHAVLGPSKLAKLVLFLKILRESTEIFS